MIIVIIVIILVVRSDLFLVRWFIEYMCPDLAAHTYTQTNMMMIVDHLLLMVIHFKPPICKFVPFNKSHTHLNCTHICSKPDVSMLKSVVKSNSRCCCCSSHSFIYSHLNTSHQTKLPDHIYLLLSFCCIVLSCLVWSCLI